ncbi:hypothetical protein RN001_008731 [Aquatica leii]|uniref:Carboxylic ester hydrolase n=1 Tax=Aquatica leii TaxID=1421715 RepID=A0AAN7P4M5_9COLE|nr:hypothetical protein RN001_008731 [Aquatica leii]
MVKSLEIFILNSFIVAVFGNFFEVNTQEGMVTGKLDVAESNRTFYSFTGIPYAAPPIGSLRFESPVRAKSWDSVFDATRSHPECVQFLILDDSISVVGDEDCLYLNIYTPQLSVSQKNLLPVLFYIHGGAFVEGSGRKELWGPKLLLTKDIVLVLFNYRLGAFGFLSTGDAAQPGNLGLKDQAFALQWVKNNIGSFGGNPEKITVMGQSAGGFSAHMHMFSPLTKNFIKGVIAQSGTALNPWGLVPIPVVKSRTKILANGLGCVNNVDTASMINCLKTKPVMDIMDAIKPMMESRNVDIIVFRPVVESDCNKAFLCQHPIELIKSGNMADVPFLCGVTAQDGALISGPILVKDTLVSSYNNHFDDFMKYSLFYADLMPLETFKKISKAIRHFYLQDNLIGNSTITEFTNIFTDACFLHPAQESVSLHANYSKHSVYNYLYAYNGTETFGQRYYGNEHDFGVIHGDELFYLFDRSVLYPNYKLTRRDKKMSDFLITLWTNFVYYGNPTPNDHSWKPFKCNEENYYIIDGSYKNEVDEGLEKERVDFWKNLWKTIS